MNSFWPRPSKTVSYHMMPDFSPRGCIASILLLLRRSGYAHIHEAIEILTVGFKVYESIAVRVPRPGRSQAQQSWVHCPPPRRFSHELSPSNYANHFWRFVGPSSACDRRSRPGGRSYRQLICYHNLQLSNQVTSNQYMFKNERQ